MLRKKKEHQAIKHKLHPRNKHRERYDFKQLIQSCPELAQFVKLNNFNDESVDFFDPEAVKMLNKALLMHFYNIKNWDIPENYLCPPVPGRADYIHHIADLLGNINNGIIPKGKNIRCLDTGIGANCIYPIIGCNEYGWSFTGSDTDKTALKSAGNIIEKNPVLQGNVELRLQTNSKDIFKGIINKDEYFDITICNPPFHISFAEAISGNIRKTSNLKHKRISNPILNFSGQNNELWCEGGESQFVQTMIHQSREFASNCLWFSSLISKESNLKSIYYTLENTEVADVKTISSGQGNKISRIIAWTFLTEEQQQDWVKTRWK